MIIFSSMPSPFIENRFLVLKKINLFSLLSIIFSILQIFLIILWAITPIRKILFGFLDPIDYDMEIYILSFALVASFIGIIFGVISHKKDKNKSALAGIILNSLIFLGLLLDLLFFLYVASSPGCNMFGC
jgi:hypothetical protein